MKALVVDDSALMRRQIGDILTRGGLQVTTARTGAEALVRIAQDAPDVVTLDINMPEMDGLTCLSRIMAECPLPVVMISSLTERGALATLEAIALGAVDFVHKPGGTVSTALRDQEDQIIAKVLAAAGASVRRASGLRQRLVARRDAIMRARAPAPARRQLWPGARGAHAGGRVHRWPGRAGRRAGAAAGRLSHADPGVPAHARHGHAPLCRAAQPVLRHAGGGSAPPDRAATRHDLPGAGRCRHDRAGAGRAPARHGGPFRARAYLAPQCQPPGGHRDGYGDGRFLIGVLLTGMGDDGARELAQLRRQGGYTIAESEESCVVYGMPRALVEQGGACEILPCPQIAARLERLAFTRMRNMAKGLENTSWAC
jgi:two-component system chemotaxis response regulator CheB